MRLAVLGATGRTGHEVVQQALEQGHEVRALARDPRKTKLTHPALTWVKGDARNYESVRELLDGTDAIVSAMGPTKGDPAICSMTTEHVLRALAETGARRYVVVSGAGLDVPGDRKDIPGKIVSFMVRTIAPAVFADKVREYTLLAGSTADFVLVRPPRLLDGEATGQVAVSLERAPGTKIRRADLASFLLTQATTSDDFVRHAPFVANR